MGWESEKMSGDIGLLKRAMAVFETLSELPSDKRRDHDLLQTLDVEARAIVERMLSSLDCGDSHWLDQPVWAHLSTMDKLNFETSRLPEADFSGREFGNWRALEPIGHGGMSVVYRGERSDGHFERQVAIKLLPTRADSPGQIERLKTEIRILARLQHPHIATLLDGGVSDQMPWLVMEYVEGISVVEYCRNQQLGIRDVVRLFEQIAEAVSHAHGRLVVHRDIKPSNILVSHDGLVKLVDFGVSGLLGPSTDDDDRPAKGVFCTPGYAAPEQIAGDPAATAHDVFALGAVLYELLCGQRMRSTGVATRLIRGQVPTLNVPPPSKKLMQLADCSGMAWPARQLQIDLDAICLKAIAEDPAERYRSVQQLSDDLKQWRQHRPVSAVNGGAVYRTRRWLRRNWLPACWAGVAAVGLSGGAGLALWQAEQARQAADEAQRQTQRVLEEQENTRRALARSEATRDFLAELFRATVPDRPREEMPDTESLLAEATEQLRLNEAQDPALRADMMATIGYLYLVRGRWTEARELLVQADQLVAPVRERDPEVYARVRMYSADLVVNDESPAKAVAQLVELEGFLSRRLPNAPAHLEAQIKLAGELFFSNDLEQALDWLDSASDAVPGLDELPVRTQQRYANLRANVLSAMGRYVEAAAAYEQTIALQLRQVGPRHRNVAIRLVNAATNDSYMGSFDQANERYERALGIYGDIYTEPSEVFASANLAYSASLAWQGRYDESLEQARLGTEQIARYHGLESAEEYLYTEFRLAFPLIEARRWDQAEPLLLRSLAKLSAAERGITFQVIVMSALAGMHCSRGETGQGIDYMRQAQAMAESLTTQGPELRAGLLEARTDCHLAMGQNEQAGDVLAQVATLEADIPLGQAAFRARVDMLRAQVMQERNNPTAARELLERARWHLMSVNLEQHPLVAELDQRLAGN